MARERFLVDEAGERVGVLLDIEEYRRISTDLEGLESIRSYDATKAAPYEAIPLAQSLREIEEADRSDVYR
jgi:hypothetical protein